MALLQQAAVVAVAAAVAAAFAGVLLPLVVAVAAYVAGACFAAPEFRTGQERTANREQGKSEHKHANTECLKMSQKQCQQQLLRKRS